MPQIPRSGLVTVVLAVVLAACGGDREPAPDVGGAAPTDPDQPVSDTPVDPGAGAGTPGPSTSAELVEPRPGMADVRPVGFEDVEADEDGRMLLVTFWSGVEPCYVLDSVEVEAGPERVEITLMQGSDPEQPDAMCIEIAKLKQVEITLDQPVDDREIVDGADA